MSWYVISQGVIKWHERKRTTCKDSHFHMDAPTMLETDDDHDDMAGAVSKASSLQSCQCSRSRILSNDSPATLLELFCYALRFRQS